MEHIEIKKLLSKGNLQRWENYRRGVLGHGDVRNAELYETLNLLKPKSGEKILEIGTGGGYLTIPIAKKIRNEGELVTADVNPEGLIEIMMAIHAKGILPQNIIVQPYSDDLFDSNKLHMLKDNSFDAVSTLATFHHFDNRSKFTGDIGRTNIINEMYKKLKPEGRLVIADVAKDTNTGKYFDAIDNPKHFAPVGHPHDFYSASELEEKLTQRRFKNVTVEVKEVPWIFNSKEQAANFLNKIHNANCPAQESLKIAEDILGFEQIGDYQYKLGWQLYFARGEK